MCVLTWSPLAWGFLSGRYRKGHPIDLTQGRPTIDATRFDPRNPKTAAKPDVVERLVELAGTNVYQHEGAWIPPAVTDAALRRRPADERAAA
jgi:aryl-alcohol dehydrogenase-like predicted oxidoreductase